MRVRRLPAALAFASALLAACGGGGSAGGPPSAVPTPLPARASASAGLSYHQPVHLAVGPVGSGVAAALDVPPATVGLGTLTATLTTALPSGVPAPASQARLIRAIGAAGISPLAFVNLTGDAYLAFYGNPVVTFTLPAAAVTPNTTAYLAGYDPQVGWYVAGPSQPLAAQMTFSQNYGAPVVAPPQSYTYMLFVAAGPVAAPTPTPVPSPSPVTTSLSLDPAAMELGGLDPKTCPTPLPDGTICSTGFNAFPVDPGTAAAAVRFFPLTGVAGTYTVSAANPALVNLLQPVPNAPDGTQIFGVSPLAVGQTTVTLRAPNGATATLPVSVTSLTLVVDATRIPAASSLVVTTAYAGGLGFTVTGDGLRQPALRGGATYTILDAPAYAATGTVPNGADPTRIVYGFSAASSVQVRVTEATRSYTSTTPLTIADGQSNTATAVVTPAP
jgi:hypothetical protein